jgi:hypothetical protein
MRFCPSCGVERVARFCSGCGFDFDQNLEPELTLDQEIPASTADASQGGAATESFEEVEFNVIETPKEPIPSSIPDLSAEGLEQPDTSEPKLPEEPVDQTAEPELTLTVQDSAKQEDKELPAVEEEVIDVVLVESEPEVVPAAPPNPEGWYPDPINKTRFRYWDGNAWTDRTALKASEVEPEEEPVQVNFELAAPVVLEGLTYGKKYRSGSSCFNCGFMPTERTNFCECCGAALKSAE